MSEHTIVSVHGTHCDVCGGRFHFGEVAHKGLRVPTCPPSTCKVPCTRTVSRAGLGVAA